MDIFAAYERHHPTPHARGRLHACRPRADAGGRGRQRPGAASTRRRWSRRSRPRHRGPRPAREDGRAGSRGRHHRRRRGQRPGDTDQRAARAGLRRHRGDRPRDMPADSISASAAVHRGRTGHPGKPQRCRSGECRSNAARLAEQARSTPTEKCCKRPPHGADGGNRARP